MKTFILKYQHKTYAFGIKKQIIDMAINASGIRDTARVLGINKNTVISTLKKKNAILLVQVNPIRVKIKYIPNQDKRQDKLCRNLYLI